jgi:hypothetical protein
LPFRTVKKCAIGESNLSARGPHGGFIAAGHDYHVTLRDELFRDHHTPRSGVANGLEELQDLRLARARPRVRDGGRTVIDPGGMIGHVCQDGCRIVGREGRVNFPNQLDVVSLVHKSLLPE